MSLLNKIKKNSKIEQTSSLEDSIYLNNQESIACSIPSLNIAMAGEVDCGMSAGTLQIAGPSKHFKTAMGLQVVASYLRQYEDAVCLFYDSEFGAAMRYFEAAGVDTERVVHSPIVDIEQLKIDIVNQMAGVQRGDRLIIFIDSIGNLASRKEVEDAMDSKTTADMTRAKQMKSLFRIITPHLVLKNVYLVAINHTYKEMSTHPRDIVSGGTGAYYSANDIWIIGRSQEKEGTEIVGYNFTINIEKSRKVKEKSKIPLEVRFDGGIDKYSGILDLAIEFGFVVQSGAWYQTVDLETGELAEKKVRGKEIGPEFFDKLLAYENFKARVRNKYQIGV